MPEPDSKTLHEELDAAEVLLYRVPEGKILVTIWNGVAHEVIYQTPKQLPWSRWLRNRELFRFYGNGLKWKEDWPIEFGFSKQRTDGKLRVLYSRLQDFMTFRTMLFNQTLADAKDADNDA